MKNNELPSISQARKIFYDFLDRSRPWANNSNMYDAMEKMVDEAAFAFRGDIRPTQKCIEELEKALLKFTTPLKTHPKNYDGPCMCEECRSNA